MMMMMMMIRLIVFVSLCWLGDNVAADGSIPTHHTHGVVYDQYHQQFEVVRLNMISSSESMCVSGVFDDRINSTGWSFLSMKTHDSAVCTPMIASESAGYFEGWLAMERIHQSVINSGTTNSPSASVLKWMDENEKWVDTQVKSNPHDEYWNHVAYLRAQLVGVYSGYHAASTKAGVQPFSESAVRLLTTGSDVETVSEALSGGENGVVRFALGGRCSALVKLTENELYAAQTTWSELSSMIRTFKVIDFTSFIRGGGGQMQFSSYPGTLFSADDFYQMWPSKLTTFETTIGYSNATMDKLVVPQSVLEWQRNMVANFMADNGTEWASIFSQFNSGTYNNEFMIVDYKKYQAGKELVPGTFVVVDQVPGHVVTTDHSVQLQRDGYFGSYNVPSSSNIFNISGWEAAVDKYGNWFTHDKTPRALIFKRDHHKVVDLESMRRLMRYNDFQHDPLSVCESCEPVQYSAENAIACRDDLNPINMTVPFSALGHRPHIATDCKVTSSTLMSKFQTQAQSSPTFDTQPVFVWSKSDYNHKVPHVGQPDVWNFPWVTMTSEGMFPLQRQQQQHSPT